MSKKKNKKHKIDNTNVDDLTNVNETAIEEYFEVVKGEYDKERDKKQSFENRAGIILTLIGAICVFLFEKISMKEIIDMMYLTLNLFNLVKVIAGLAVYSGLIFTIIKTLKTIIVVKHDNFEVKNIDEELLNEEKFQALCRIIFTYRNIIIQHRELNEKRAKAFRSSLYGITVTLVATVVYISLV